MAPTKNPSIVAESTDAMADAAEAVPHADPVKLSHFPVHSPPLKHELPSSSANMPGQKSSSKS
jgi:hypothetical protein